MIRLERERWSQLRPFFEPERPGPLIGKHIIHTGHGGFLVDRWPGPRAVLAQVGTNATLVGDAGALRAEDLAGDWRAMVEAPAEFLPLLRAARPDVRKWDRVIFELPAKPTYEITPGVTVRRLAKEDAARVEALGPQIQWIADTFEGPSGLAASSLAWGAFVQGELASVAATFFVGEHYEDMGVVSEAAFRGRGLSPACAGRLAEDIRARNRIPSWSTSPDNLPSLRVAEKLGFKKHRDDALYVTGMPIPGAAAPG